VRRPSRKRSSIHRASQHRRSDPAYAGITFQRDATTVAGNFNDEDSDINIRGVDSTAGTSTVGIYIDDTPIQGRHISFTSFNAYPALFDLERVEVLRGPQELCLARGQREVRFDSYSHRPTCTPTRSICARGCDDS